MAQQNTSREENNRERQITNDEINAEINHLREITPRNSAPDNQINIEQPTRIETRTAVLDQILEEVRALQDRISRLEVQVYEHEVQRNRWEYGREPLEVTYGRTHSDVRNQAAHVTGYLQLKEARDMIPEFDGTSQAKLKEFLSACAYD